LILYLAFTLLAVVVLTGAVRRYALKHGVMDRPNDRSAHTVPTPRGGGVAFVVVYLGLLCLVFALGPPQLAPSPGFLSAMVIAGGSVAWIGFLDDKGGVPIRYRFLVHVLAATLACFLLDMPEFPANLLPHWLSVLWVPVIALAIVWNINLFNFMDGIDGIASIEAISVTGGAAWILYIVGSDDSAIFWPLALSAGVTGFLVWNWPPARIFMGDSASGFLGFTIAAMALYTSARGGISLWSWLILMAVFLVDASWTLARRVFSGQRWYQAHASHAYQIMARNRIEEAALDVTGADRSAARSSSHLWVIGWITVINLLWLLPLAIGASIYPAWGGLLAAVAVIPLLLIVGRIGAGGAETAHPRLCRSGAGLPAAHHPAI